MFCLLICLCTTCVHGAFRDQKRASDHLILELLSVVNCHVHAGNQSWAPWKNSKFSQPLIEHPEHDPTILSMAMTLEHFGRSPSHSQAQLEGTMTPSTPSRWNLTICTNSVAWYQYLRICRN